jgi:hypothetical protein
MRPRRAETSEPALGKAENIVDEEQHVLALVAKILATVSPVSPTRARPWRLVHLAIDERAFRALAEPPCSCGSTFTFDSIIS